MITLESVVHELRNVALGLTQKSNFAGAGPKTVASLQATITRLHAFANAIVAQAQTHPEHTYDLQRTRELLASARRTCEDRTRERDQARAVLARQAEAAAVGAAVLGLLEQIHRLRRTPCPTMGFGFSPAEIAEAVLSEVFEVKAEQPGSSRAQHETVGVLATALHLTIAHDTPLLDGLLAETARLRARLDHVDRGGTWKEAKTMETERELTPPCTD